MTTRIENINGPIRNAWLSVDGSLYHVEDYGHVSVAVELGDREYGDGLEDKGWMHISFNRTRYVSNHSNHTPNQRQLDVLWDIFVALDRALKGTADYVSGKWADVLAELRRLLKIGDAQ